MWKQLGQTVIAAFLASFVEFVEALTIVLAVWTVRGWKPAIAGAAAGTLLLVLVTLLFGPLLRLVPIDVLRLAIGVLLLLFGVSWLRKAILRSAGIVALHDESTAFKKETLWLAKARRRTWHGIDAVGAGTTFNAVVLEGLEVVFIVIALGATGGMLIPASVGALAAGVVVLLLGLIVHKPLSQVPENSLKFIVGIVISAYGVFWVGEGAGFNWWGGDLALVGIATMLFLCAVLTIAVSSRHRDSVS